MQPTLSILICTLNGREDSFNELIKSLSNQYNGLDVEVVFSKDSGEISTGKKRNELLKTANGKYVCFIDDDDEVFPYYIDEILKAAEQDCDCIGMCGIMTTDGRDEIGWQLSKDFENDTVIRNGKKFYLRKTNHISPVKRELALLVGFPDYSHGEDKYYSDNLNKYLKTEATIPAHLPIYHYKYVTRQKEYLR